MTRVGEEMRLEAKRDGIAISGHLLDAIDDLVLTEGELAYLTELLESQGGPNDVNLPLRHEIYTVVQDLRGKRDHAEFQLGRAAAKKAASVGFIGDMPSSALSHVSF